MEKLISSDATKKLYWKRKKADQGKTNHGKRVDTWRATKKRFDKDGRDLNAGARPIPKDYFLSNMWR